MLAATTTTPPTLQPPFGAPASIMCPRKSLSHTCPGPPPRYVTGIYLSNPTSTTLCVWDVGKSLFNRICSTWRTMTLFLLIEINWIFIKLHRIDAVDLRKAEFLHQFTRLTESSFRKATISSRDDESRNWRVQMKHNAAFIESGATTVFPKPILRAGDWSNLWER